MNDRFGREDLRPFLEGLLANLFKVLDSEQSRENDYVMKGIHIYIVLGSISFIFERPPDIVN